MIRSLSIENFYSIRDRVDLTFRVPKNAPSRPAFRLSRSGARELIPATIAFYGPNASGKSTVIRAITSVIDFVTNSIALKPDEMIPHFSPFMTENSASHPTRISMEFEARWIGNTDFWFQYDLAIAYRWANGDSGHHRRAVVGYESLSYRPGKRLRRLFKRVAGQEQSVQVGDEFELSSSDPRFKAIKPNSSVIATLATLNHPLSVTIWEDVRRLGTNLVGQKKAVELGAIFSFYADNPDALLALNRELQRLDIGLNELQIVEGPSGPWGQFIHDGLHRPIQPADESHGTIRFLEVFMRIHYALQSGHVVVIDELDADLHSLVIPELLRWFDSEDRNPHGAQLFFTAHNPSVLDDLEKEQIFLTNKDSTGATTVFGVRDILGLRREPSLMKKYLGGELGAVPHIG
ncbi:MAG: AAA family ATPase [Inquilinaceae bacterium]